MRTVTAAVLAIAGVTLGVFGGPSLITSIGARYAGMSNCDDDLLAVPSGTWVKLAGCGVDMFHPSFLVDTSGERTHRLVPLRRPGESSAELSAFALAIPTTSAPDAYQAKPGPESEKTQVADLAETSVVALANLDQLAAQVAPFPGFESGLTQYVKLFELRPVPPLQRSAIFVAAALLSLAAAAGVFYYRPAPAVARPRPASKGSSVIAPTQKPSVRWGLVFLATLVGIVGLWRVIGWQFDPALQPPAKRPAAAPRRPPARSTAADSLIPTPPPTPPATTQQLMELVSPDPAVQMRAARMLRNTAITPELMTSVDAALARKPDEALEAQLICIKSRDTSPGSLDFLLERFPSGDKKAPNWTRMADVICVLDALVGRATEAPARIRDAILPVIYSGNFGAKEKVVKAFRTMNLDEIPQKLVVEASTNGTPFQHEAMDAAIALGAIRLEPGLLTTGLKNYNTTQAVAYELRTSPHPNAAKIVAMALGSSQYQYRTLGFDRERQFHDVSTALLAIVLDASQTEAQRTVSAYQLGMLGEVGPLPDLKALSASLERGKFKTTVNEAIKQLEDLVKHGVKPRMLPLAS